MPRKAASAAPTADHQDAPPDAPPDAELDYPPDPSEVALLGFDDLASLDDQGEYLNGLWYGDNGTGKTSAIAAMANLGRTVVVNAESGLKRRPLQRLGINTNNILVFPNVEKGQRLTFNALEQLYWSMAEQLERDPASMAGICWDSLTDIHRKLLDQIVEHQVSKAERAGKDRDRFFIDRADYGVMSEQVRLLLRRFRDLPCHLAITALERRDQDDDGEVSYGPAVSPALQNDVMGYVDVVCHTRVLEVDGVPQYRALTTKGTKYAAKDRYGVLPGQMIDPTFERVFRYTTEELTADTDQVQADGKAAVARVKARQLEEAATTEAKTK